MNLLPIIKSLAGKRVLVVGDLILDSYIWGKVSRISPEAPVPVVDVVRKTYALGGAANVGANVVSLGGRATVVGIVGADAAAARMADAMADAGIAFEAIEGERPTTVKTRVIAHSQQVVRFDQESRDALSPQSLKALTACLKRMLKEHDAVVVSDYRKGVVTQEVIRAAASAARAGMFAALDPKVGNFHLYKGMSIMTPNLMEASQGSGMEIADEAGVIRAGRKLMRITRSASMLITRGEGGMSLLHDGMVTHIPTMAKHVYDVTGAGDTVIAALTLARAAGASLEEAAVLANHAAGIVVGEVGTAMATVDGLRKSIRAAKFDLRREPLA